MSYKYPSVRLVLCEGMTSAAKSYAVGPLALKSMNRPYLEFPLFYFFFLADCSEVNIAMHDQSFQKHDGLYL